MNGDNNEAFPMYGTWDNLYAGLDNENERKEVPFTAFEIFKRFLVNNRWYVRGNLLINDYLKITEDHTGKIHYHVSGFPMWKLQDIADKRNTFRIYYWAGWHTQTI